MTWKKAEFKENFFNCIVPTSVSEVAETLIFLVNFSYCFRLKENSVDSFHGNRYDQTINIPWQRQHGR